MAALRTTANHVSVTKIFSSMFLNYYIYICILLTLTGARACKFPKYLERNTAWMTHNHKGNRVRGYFQGSILRASRCDSEGRNCVTYSITCLSKQETNKFQVKHSFTEGDAPKYSCMQILRRSDNIIQIRESQQQMFRNPNACNNEHLILDNWPMTNYENFDKQKIPCPFIGGYNIRFHTSDRQPTCATEIIPTRLESECETGEGMTITFPSKECMDPNLDMDLQQELYCAATWVHGNYTFLIIRPQSDDYKLWCMRMRGTDVNNRLDHAEIFTDIVCDPGDGNGVLRETSNYLMIEFEKRAIASTCEDSYSFCDDTRLCSQETYSIHCRRVCGRCSGIQNQCSFPPSLKGLWIEQERGEKNEVDIQTYSLTISNRGRFTCNEKEIDHDFSNNTMLLQTFDNGCFPRHSCFEVHKPFSSVLEYRIGNHMIWPVKNLDTLKDDVCDESMFKPNRKDRDVYGKGIEEKPMKILVDSEHNSYHVDCGFEEWLGFRLNSAYLQDENGCDVCLFHDHSRRHDAVVTQPMNCSMPKRQYHCLGVFPQDESTHAVVTRTLHLHQEYRCWVFIDGDQRTEIAGTVYVLEAAFCSSVAIEALKDGNLQPLHSYLVPKNPPRQCPYVSIDPVFTTPHQIKEITTRGRNGPQFPNTWGPLPPTDMKSEEEVGSNTIFPPPMSYDPNRTPPTDSLPVNDGLSSSSVSYMRPTSTVFYLSLFSVCLFWKS